MEEENDDVRKALVLVNVSSICSSRELHSVIKYELGLPSFYGMNWNAYWDAITGLIELPETLVFKGWYALSNVLPEDSKILIKLMDQFNKKHPSWRCNVIYK
jgi:RNAse (barnase) inhibitor barstar